MDKDSKFTRDEEGYIAVRVVSGTEALPAADKDCMFARDTNGNIAVRVVGAGGGDSHNKGFFATVQALQEAYPTAEDGDYAVVGATDTVWLWDSDSGESGAWVDSDTKGQVTSVNGQTGAVTLGINDVAPTQTGKSGYVLGTDGFVAGWVKPEIVQRSALPQASEDELGNVYQFVGTTDANYTNGYFYKCVSDGQNPATYSWSQVDVQPAADPLPSQTGNAGKVLMTNGTTASWEDVSSSPTIAPALIAANWSSNQQTVNVSGVTATNTVIVAPFPTDAQDYATAGILCIGQGAGTLTFSCTSVPANDLQVNVVII